MGDTYKEIKPALVWFLSMITGAFGSIPVCALIYNMTFNNLHAYLLTWAIYGWIFASYFLYRFFRYGQNSWYLMGGIHLMFPSFGLIDPSISVGLLHWLYIYLSLMMFGHFAYRLAYKNEM